jgi:2-polyprenyl-6-methoxyphenol hydroxylase-like FAD-dependent oxidoreductase
MAPQNFDGSEVLAGTQRKFPEQDKKGWETLWANKKKLVGMLRENEEGWPDIVKSALENIQKDSLTTWPFYVVPRLESWASKGGRVVILGDAAHAIPPTAGQGASQAFEDAYSFVLLISKLGPKVGMRDALWFWEGYRKERVDKILELTKRLNVQRLPVGEREREMEIEKRRLKGVSGMGEGEEQRWLLEPRIEEVVLEWVESQRQQEK